MVLGVLVALLVAVVLWIVIGRERASELSDDQAVTEFRAAADGAPESSSDLPGRPAAGVYAATAVGTESIGIPGFDEELGPNAPVTVVHGENGCFTFRVDLNSHHWRSWTLCPTDTADLSLVELESWSARKAPGLDLETLTTYTCERPPDVRWQGAVAGSTSSGACTGRSDMDDGVTRDIAEVEVLSPEAITIDGQRIEAERVRIDDTFSEAQTGYETGEWWFDPASGLPIRLSISSELQGGPSTYSEQFDLELTTLMPAT